MSITLEVESTLTDRYQTTIPETVRRALQLGKRDKLHYAIRSGGEVVLTRVQGQDEEDPVLTTFLNFLARDMASHPEHLQVLDVKLPARIDALVGKAEIDLDAPLSVDDE